MKNVCIKLLNESQNNIHGNSSSKHYIFRKTVNIETNPTVKFATLRTKKSKFALDFFFDLSEKDVSIKFVGIIARMMIAKAMLMTLRSCRKI